MISIVSSAHRVDLPLEGHVGVEVCSRIVSAMARLGVDEVSRQVSYALLQVALALDAPARLPPTAAQLKYATDLALKLRIEVPAEAFGDRLAMGAFLSLHSSAAARK